MCNYGYAAIINLIKVAVYLALMATTWEERLTVWVAFTREKMPNPRCKKPSRRRQLVGNGSIPGETGIIINGSNQRPLEELQGTQAHSQPAGVSRGQLQVRLGETSRSFRWSADWRQTPVEERDAVPQQCVTQPEVGRDRLLHESIIKLQLQFWWFHLRPLKLPVLALHKLQNYVILLFFTTSESGITLDLLCFLTFWAFCKDFCLFINSNSVIYSNSFSLKTFICQN